MIKDIRSIIGTKILQQDTGDILGLLNYPIVDPDTGVIEAFWVKPLTLPIRHAILQTSSILSFKKNIYIKSDKVIADPAEVIRIAGILDEERQLIGNSVEGEEAKYYGRIYNLSFSVDTYVIRQIYSCRSILGFFKFDRRIFPYERVVRVLSDKVIINDDTKNKKAVLNTPPEPA